MLRAANKQGRFDRTDWGMLHMPPNPSVPLLFLADQINWFNRRSQQNQTKYKWMKASIYVAASLITISPALAQYQPVKESTTFIVAAMGAYIILFERLLVMNDCRRNWLHYRQVCEDLKREKFWMLAKAGPYRGAYDADALLTERVQDLLAEARAAWMAVRDGDDHESKNEPGASEKANASRYRGEQE